MALYNSAYDIYKSINKNKAKEATPATSGAKVNNSFMNIQPKKSNAVAPTNNEVGSTPEVTQETPTVTQAPTNPSPFENTSSVYNDWLNLSKQYQKAGTQNYLAAQNAKKYLNNSLAMKGVAGQGATESNSLGIQNAYLANNANLDTNYQSNVMDLKQKEVDVAKEAQAKNLAYATSQLENIAPNYTTEEEWKKLYDTYSSKLGEDDKTAFDEEYNARFKEWQTEKAKDTTGKGISKNGVYTKTNEDGSTVSVNTTNNTSIVASMYDPTSGKTIPIHVKIVDTDGSPTALWAKGAYPNMKVGQIVKVPTANPEVPVVYYVMKEDGRLAMVNYNDNGYKEEKLDKLVEATK